MVHRKTLEFRTRGRGTEEVTAELQRAVAACGIRTGVATVFLQHTSASLVLFESNAAGAYGARGLSTSTERLISFNPSRSHCTTAPPIRTFPSRA